LREFPPASRPFLEKNMFTEAFEEFMDKDFRAAVDSATKASWHNLSSVLELFVNGAYRILLWDEENENSYKSRGLIVSIPPLPDEDWDEDPENRCYDKAEQKIRDEFKGKLNSSG
jgi:hypothetical protein